MRTYQYKVTITHQFDHIACFAVLALGVIVLAILTIRQMKFLMKSRRGKEKKRFRREHQEPRNQSGSRYDQHMPTVEFHLFVSGISSSDTQTEEPNGTTPKRPQETRLPVAEADSTGTYEHGEKETEEEKEEKEGGSQCKNIAQEQSNENPVGIEKVKPLIYRRWLGGTPPPYPAFLQSGDGNHCDSRTYLREVDKEGYNFYGSVEKSEGLTDLLD